MMISGHQVIITEKMDGGNCCLFGGNVYARTHKHPTTHASFGPVKQIYANMQLMDGFEGNKRWQKQWQIVRAIWDRFSLGGNGKRDGWSYG